MKHQTISFQQIFTKRNSPTISNRTSMNIRSSLPTNRTHINHKATIRGAAYKISRNTSAINNRFRAYRLKLSRRLLSIQNRRNIRVSILSILAKGRSNVRHSQLHSIMLSNRLRLTVKPRVESRHLLTRHNRPPTRTLNRHSKRQRRF